MVGISVSEVGKVKGRVVGKGLVDVGSVKLVNGSEVIVGRVGRIALVISEIMLLMGFDPPEVVGTVTGPVEVGAVVPPVPEDGEIPATELDVFVSDSVEV